MGLVDALQPQQPELEIARQRLDRHAGRHCLDHRCAEAEERFVRVGLLRPLVDELGEVLGIPERNARSEEHTSELQSRLHLVCRLLLEKKKKKHPLHLLIELQAQAAVTGGAAGATRRKLYAVARGILQRRLATSAQPYDAVGCVA